MVYTYDAIFSGFYSSIERQEEYELVLVTIYLVVRIAAVSQERVLVCIARKVTRPENDMVLVLASNLTSLCRWYK